MINNSKLGIKLKLCDEASYINLLIHSVKTELSYSGLKIILDIRPAGCSIAQPPSPDSEGRMPDIESLVFWISNAIEPFGKACRKHR